MVELVQNRISVNGGESVLKTLTRFKLSIEYLLMIIKEVMTIK